MKAVEAVPTPVNTDVIRVLEEALAEAQKGLISDVAIAYVMPTGVTGNNFSHTQNRSATLLGATYFLQRDMMDAVESVSDV